MSDHKLYEKLLDTLLTLRDTADHFRIRSAQDNKTLIASTLKAVRREPKDLQLLYQLETTIADLRKAFLAAREELEA